MYDLLVKLMLAAALAQLGLSALKGRECADRPRALTLETGSRDILRIDWKPISLFPKEAQKFR